MGDVKELTTSPGQNNIFYRVSSSGFLFEVKAASCAAVGLAKKPGNKCDVWVVIGHDRNGHQTWITKEDGHGKKCRTPNILSDTEYRPFWLSWRSGCIELGRGNEKSPIISYQNSANFNYITFSSKERNLVGARNMVYWRFELPPTLEKPKFTRVTGGELRWERVGDHLPEDAFIGGCEKETLYIIRAPHRGSLTPGKLVPSQNTGYISWGGQAHSKNEYEVLCGYDCVWVPTTEDRIPVNAVVGGYSERQREPLYIARALYKGHLIPGKVHTHYRLCYIPYEGREISLSKYEILVSPGSNARSANKLFIGHIDIESPNPSDNEDHDDNDDDDDDFVDGGQDAFF